MTAKQLRAARRRLKLSVSKAAKLVHVTGRTWSRWESGAVPVPGTAAHLFCLLHGIPFTQSETKRNARS